MGVLLNADADYLSLAAAPGATGMIDWTIWGWVRRTSGVGYAAVSQSNMFGVEGNAGRAMGLGYDSTFVSGSEADPNLCVKDTQTGDTDFTTDPSFDTWTFFVLTVTGPAGSAVMTAEWSTNGTTWNTCTRNPSGIEDSIVPASTYIGRMLSSEAQTTYGDYAYVGVRNEYMNETARRALFNRTATATGDWAYWRLLNSSTLTDSSGNGRTLTANGTVTDGADPSLMWPHFHKTYGGFQRTLVTM